MDKLRGAGSRKAAVLLSGGLDSSTALAIAKSERFEIYALSFFYGQRHRVELEAARRARACITNMDAQAEARGYRSIFMLGGGPSGP